MWTLSFINHGMRIMQFESQIIQKTQNKLNKANRLLSTEQRKHNCKDPLVVQTI